MPALRVETFCFLFHFFFISCAILPPFEPLRINCGGPDVQDSRGVFWKEDVYYLGGKALYLKNTEASNMETIYTTLRYFGNGDTNCYLIPAPVGRYFVRSSFWYHNFDGKHSPPSMRVYLEGVLVESMNLGKPKAGFSGNGAYSTDYFVTSTDGHVEFCLLPDDGRPFVNTLEVFPADSDSYDSGAQKSFLSNIVRINVGGYPLHDTYDAGHRFWAGDSSYTAWNHETVETSSVIQNVGVSPNFLPAEIFQQSRVGKNGILGYSLLLQGLSSLNEWLLCLHFAEVEPNVRIGDRVFDIQVNSVVVSQFDILKATQNRSFTAATVLQPFTFKLASYASPSNLIINLIRSNDSVRDPILAALEVYEAIKFGTARENLISGKQKKPNSGLTTQKVVALCIGTIGFTFTLSAIVSFLWLWRKQHNEGILIDNDFVSREGFVANGNNLRHRNVGMQRFVELN